MMFTVPAKSPEVAIHAAGRAQVEFVRVVGSVVGDGQAHLYGAMLLTSALGIASMGASDHLDPRMWQTTPGNVLDALVGLIVDQVSSDAEM